MQQPKIYQHFPQKYNYDEWVEVNMGRGGRGRRSSKTTFSRRRFLLTVRSLGQEQDSSLLRVISTVVAVAPFRADDGG